MEQEKDCRKVGEFKLCHHCRIETESIERINLAHQRLPYWNLDRQAA